MEHLAPAQFKERGLKLAEPVAWLGFPDHDKSPTWSHFLGYPKSCGWDVGKDFDRGELELTVTDPTGKPASKEATLAFLQSWLYFGFIEATIRRKIDIRQFIVRDENGKELLNTYPLVNIFEEWSLIVVKIDHDTELYRTWEENTGRIMLAVSGVFNRLTRNWDHEVFPTVPVYFYPILRSISILFETVRWILPYIFPDNNINLPRSAASLYPEYVSDLVPFFEREVVNRGYCPFQVRNASDLSGFPLLEYMKTNVLLPVTDDDHGDCEWNGCRLYDRFKYDVKDVCPCGSGCRRVRPDIEIITEILSERFVPIISYDADTNELQLGRAQEDSSYVAFSHVWADGLGSCSEIGLFRCQVRRLASLAEQAMEIYPELSAAEKSSPVYFWIDSLCVPEERGHRKKAIRLMSRTYANASVVCIMDRYIRAAKNPTKLELLTRTLISGWQYRLWTLQEGLLAQKIAFESTDGVSPYPHPHVGCTHRADNIIEHTLETFLEEWLIGGLAHKEPDIWKLNVAHIVNHLGKRRTKRPSDETLAIAPIMGLDVMQIYDLEGEARMVKLLQMATYLPPLMIFRRGERCKTPKFTWAHTTFMIDGPVEDQNVDTGDVSGLCTSKGLWANYDILLPNNRGWKGKIGTEYNFTGKHAEFDSGRFMNRIQDEKSQFYYKILLTKDLPQDCRGKAFNMILLPKDDFAGAVVAVWYEGTATRDVEANEALLRYTRTAGRRREEPEVRLKSARYPGNAAVIRQILSDTPRDFTDVQALIVDFERMLKINGNYTEKPLREFWNCRFVGLVTILRLKDGSYLEPIEGDVMPELVPVTKLERNIHLV